MIRTIQFLIFTFLSFSAFSQVYVDIDAIGSADGSSWANAFTDLESAIAITEEGGEIWIAEGTYPCPSTETTNNVYFTIDVNMGIFGGFNGTESSIEDRDVELYKVILDADQNDDDVEGEGQTNRDDNNRHVMFIAETVTNNTVIDGITFKGGTTEPAAGSGDDRRGGGMLCYGSPIVNNCTFTENYGHFGGGIYPRGALADGASITNCDFINNYGTFGVGAYVLANVTLEDLYFEGNTGSGRGIGMYLGGFNNTIENCTFKDNSSFGSSGGALQLRTLSGEDSITVNVINCEFNGNFATFGGAVGSYDSLAAMVFEDCLFRNNTCTNVGGASTNAFGAKSTFKNCVFDSNMSDGSGGANFSQNDDAIITIENCQYFGNSAEFGGAMSINSDEEGDFLPVLNIDGADIFINSATVQAAGINLVNTNANLVNMLVTNNFSNGENVLGGAMSVNVSDSISVNTTIINSTFADNSADLIPGIASWEGGPEANSVVILQNVILSNSGGDNYGIEDGEPELTSNGGNLSTDDSAIDVLTGMNDFNSESIDFIVGPGDYEYYPGTNSSAINNGIPEGAPATDLFGNDRIGLMDIGALENQEVISVLDYLKAKTDINISPNPILGNEVYMNISSKYIGEVTIEIVDTEGRVIYSQNVIKSSETQNVMLENLSLVHGVYFVKITDPISTSSSSFISIK